MEIGNEYEVKYFLNPGYIFASCEKYLVHTVLGSCVSVCLWDARIKAGGMNHYIYPFSNDGTRSAKYGDVSIACLLRLVSRLGCDAKNLRAHIVGGASNPHLSSVIGDRNVEIACMLLKQSGIEVVNADTGGMTGRKVVFNNHTGELLVYKGVDIRKNDWY